MKFAVVVAAISACAFAVPFSYPLPNGFPNPSEQAFLEIQRQSGGPNPNSPPFTTLSEAAINRLRLVAANELFEVAYFSSLYHNITTGVRGYELHGKDADFIKSSIKRIVYQEQMHAIGANDILKDVGKEAVQPCKYQFPVTNFESAIELASTFTDVVIGTLPELQSAGAAEGGDGAKLVPLFSVIIANEAEQNGWFRSVIGQAPSSSSYLTIASYQFALSAVKEFLVPGSCPASYAAVEKVIKPFPPLTVVTKPTTNSKTVTFSVNGNVDAAKNAIAYVSGVNVPVTVPIKNVQKKGGKTTFSADFPAKITPTAGFSSGLTIAALTSTKRTYTNITDIAGSTLFGPGLIEYNF